MPKGQLFINGYDAYVKWGMSMDSNALSALMTPAGAKENIHTTTRSWNGQKVSKTNVKKTNRSVSVVFQICAKTEVDFFAKYESFCKELEKGFLYVSTSFQQSVCYRFEYNQCSQFTQFMRGIAKFTLKLTENDPTDRTVPTPAYDATYKVGTKTCKKNGVINFSLNEGTAYETSGFDLEITPNCTYDDIKVNPEKCTSETSDGTFSKVSETENKVVLHFSGEFNSLAETEIRVKYKNGKTETTERFTMAPRLVPGAVG